jgi:methylglyoxal synthase
LQRCIESLQFVNLNNLYMEIAIIAHDGKKADMVQFLMEHKELLKAKEINLISTGTTGSKVEAAGLEVNRYFSGPLGGDAQIAARVAEGKTEMVIFFRDPLEKHPHEPDIFMLMRLCDVYNVPLATNPATARSLINSI